MDQFERDEKIYVLRENGTTFAKIAKISGVSRERTRQIYLRAKDRKENFDSWAPLKKLLSNRTQTILNKSFMNENILENPQKLASLGKIKLLKIKNIGIKTIKDLAAALQALGFIKHDNKWCRGRVWRH